MKKQKHTWAVQIMNELLHYTSSYEYDDTGANPMAADTEAYDVIKAANTNQEDKNKETGDSDNTKQGIYNLLYILLTCELSD